MVKQQMTCKICGNKEFICSKCEGRFCENKSCINGSEKYKKYNQIMCDECYNNPDRIVKKMKAVYNLSQLIGSVDRFGYDPEIEVNFGKHKGQKLNKIPKSYVKWARGAVKEDEKQKEVEKSPILTCPKCGGKTKEISLDTGEIFDIESDEFNRDVLTYKCKNCKETVKSLRQWGKRKK